MMKFEIFNNLLDQEKQNFQDSFLSTSKERIFQNTLLNESQNQ